MKIGLPRTGFEDLGGLGKVVGGDGLPIDLGRINGISRIAHQELPFHGLGEGLLENAVHVPDRTGRQST
jgi:hypothetical protein